MKKVLMLFVAPIICIASTELFAKPIQVELKLVELKSLVLTESNDDEVYITVTSPEKKGLFKHQRIPPSPQYWTFTVGKSISDISLWNETLQNGETRQLNIAVVERDPFRGNADDLIGYVVVNVSLNKNKIETKWELPPVKNMQPTKQIGENNYMMFGDEGRYNIVLKIIRHRE